jgi:hypothetical protein
MHREYIDCMDLADSLFVHHQAVVLSGHTQTQTGRPAVCMSVKNMHCSPALLFARSPLNQTAC